MASCFDHMYSFLSPEFVDLSLFSCCVELLREQRTDAYFSSLLPPVFSPFNLQYHVAYVTFLLSLIPPSYNLSTHLSLPLPPLQLPHAGVILFLRVT